MPGLINLVKYGPPELTLYNSDYIYSAYKLNYLKKMNEYKKSANIEILHMCNYKFLTNQEKNKCKDLINEIYKEWQDNKYTNDPSYNCVMKYYELENKFFNLSYFKK